MSPHDCPCHSSERYKACCQPYHSGARLPASPEALMRSRYSAFALGLGRYLLDTLDADHPDRSGDEAALVQALSSARQRQRFLGLRILDTALVGDDEGEVLFRARVFERGADRSFVELSRFHRHGEAWRYSSGVLLPGSACPADAPLTRASFLAMAERR